MKPKVHDKATLLKLLTDNSEQLRAYGLKKLGLFGSFVRDKDIRRNSDIDLLVEYDFEKLTFDSLMDLYHFLKDLTGRKIELVHRENINKHIKPYILKEVENVGLQRRYRVTKSRPRRSKRSS